MYVFWLVAWIVAGTVVFLNVGVIRILLCVIRCVKELAVVCWLLLLIVRGMESLVKVLIVSRCLKASFRKL